MSAFGGAGILSNSWRRAIYHRDTHSALFPSLYMYKVLWPDRPASEVHRVKGVATIMLHSSKPIPRVEAIIQADSRE